MSSNALLINPKSKKIEDITLISFHISKIKSNIKKFSIFPSVFEKIVLDYKNNLTMITEFNKASKKKNGFYFKGFFIESKAIVVEAVFSKSVSPVINFKEIEDISNAKDYLSKRIVFSEEDASISQKMQISIITNIIDAGINPFDVIFITNTKYSLGAYKIIDIIDELVASTKSNSKEILKNILKGLQLTLKEKEKEKGKIYNDTLEHLQKMLSLVNFDEGS